MAWRNFSQEARTENLKFALNIQLMNWAKLFLHAATPPRIDVRNCWCAVVTPRFYHDTFQNYFKKHENVQITESSKANFADIYIVHALLTFTAIVLFL